MKLNKILSSEDIDLVLVDTSITGTYDFAEAIYESTKYSSLDVGLLEKEIESIKQAKEVLENPKTRTIRATTKELKDFEKIINSKIKDFSEGYLSKNRKIRTKIKKRDIKPKNKLNLLQNEAYNLRRISYFKELKIKDNNYELLLDMIKLIEPIIKIKKDRDFMFGFHDKDQSRDSDTDERLTAALYWLSLFSDKSSCLITNDEDFAGLSRIIIRLIGSGSFLPHNEFFRKRIIENPSKIYKGFNGEFSLSIDNSFASYDEEFLIRGSFKRVNETIKGGILKMWRGFNPSNPSKKHEYQTALAY